MVVVGKSVLFAREVRKIRREVSCFDNHDARTLDDLTQRLQPSA